MKLFFAPDQDQTQKEDSSPCTLYRHTYIYAYCVIVLIWAFVQCSHTSSRKQGSTSTDIVLDGLTGSRRSTLLLDWWPIDVSSLRPRTSLKTSQEDILKTFFVNFLFFICLQLNIHNYRIFQRPVVLKFPEKYKDRKSSLQL